jgi:ubiquinone/menaquinone biosynthesis C-methylase UbiE
MAQESRVANVDEATVAGFGDEWASYDQTALDPIEHQRVFDSYFSIFPFESLPADAEGFDLGCGSGRWAEPVAKRVGILHCIDPAEKALAVARRRLADMPGARFHLASSDTLPLADGSQDFGYSLGVLHCVPDAGQALSDCARKLKPGAPFLAYIHYRFDNRPGWYRLLWRVSDLGRRVISRLPFGIRKAVTQVIAACVYWPTARFAAFVERRGGHVEAFPLAAYRDRSFYTIRTDALDRFGTRVEHRFTRQEIVEMMQAAGLEDIRFREDVPYWTACGRKAA